MSIVFCTGFESHYLPSPTPLGTSLVVLSLQIIVPFFLPVTVLCFIMWVMVVVGKSNTQILHWHCIGIMKYANSQYLKFRLNCQDVTGREMTKTNKQNKKS